MWFALLISRALANSEFSLRKRRNFIWINQSHQISGIKNQGPGDGFIFHFMSPNLCIRRLFFIWISFVALLKIFEISPFASRLRTTPESSQRLIEATES